MNKHIRKVILWMAMAGGGGMLLQVPAFTSTTGAGPISCGRFASNGLLSSVDMCYLLDCQNGFLGGVIDPCNDPSAGIVLLDCVGLPTTTGGTGTGGDTNTTTGTGTTQTGTTTTGQSTVNGLSGFGGLGGT